MTKNRDKHALADRRRKPGKRDGVDRSRRFRFFGRAAKLSESRVNRAVLVSAATIVGGVFLLAALQPAMVSDLFTALVEWTGNWFGSFYILLLTAATVLVVYLGASRFGHLRLGPNSSRPEFSTRSWVAMLFAAGIGTDIIFFAIAEPVSQFYNPPVGAGETAEAARKAITWTLFHYGINGWGLYTLIGVALGYMAFRHGDQLSIRSMLRPVLGERVDGIIGDIVDTFALIGGVFGIAASLGIGVVQLNVGLNVIFGIPVGTGAQIGLAALAVLMATISVVSGIDRGVRFLSNLNVFLALGLAAWVVITGKTTFLLNAVVANVGDFIKWFPGLTLETFPYEHPQEWLNAWTLFFWAWWVAWAAFVGMFLARISRGRRIREFVLGTMILPFCYILMWVAIFGNTALERILRGDSAFGKTVLEAPEQGLYIILGDLPAGPVITVLAVFIGLLFFVTSADSGALVMTHLSMRGLREGEDGPVWLKIFWAALTGGLTVAMLVAGGITILQQATVVMALPFSFVVILAAWGLVRALRKDTGED